MKEAGWTDAPIKVVDWSEEKQKEFIIKDNVSGGEWDWDLLSQEKEWTLDELKSWGVDIADDWGSEPKESEHKEKLCPECGAKL